MSKFEELQTEIRSTRFLGEALSIMGHAPEMHSGGVTIKDYYGNPYPQQVEVVVRKTGSFLSDFGFARMADGRLALVVDDLDRQYQLGPQWMGRLLQTYKEQETIAIAKARGYVFRGREVTQTGAGPQIRPPVCGPVTAGGKEHPLCPGMKKRLPNYAARRTWLRLLATSEFRPRCTPAALRWSVEGRERPERVHGIVQRQPIGPASNDRFRPQAARHLLGALRSEYDRRIGSTTSRWAAARGLQREAVVGGQPEATSSVNAKSSTHRPAFQVRLQFLAR